MLTIPSLFIHPHYDTITTGSYELIMEALEEQGLGDHHSHVGDSPSSASLSLPASFDEPLDFGAFLPPPAANTTSSSRAPPSQLPSHLLSARLLELEAQVEHLQHGRAMVENHLRHEREQATVNLQKSEEKWKKEIDGMRVLQMELQEKLRLAKLRNDDQRAPFRDLEISEACYQDLCRQPEDELSLREFVAMRTHAQVNNNNVLLLLLLTPPFCLS